METQTSLHNIVSTSNNYALTAHATKGGEERARERERKGKGEAQRERETRGDAKNGDDEYDGCERNDRAVDRRDRRWEDCYSTMWRGITKTGEANESDRRGRGTKCLSIDDSTRLDWQNRKDTSTLIVHELLVELSNALVKAAAECGGDESGVQR